jgi:hypothetical protein
LLVELPREIINMWKRFLAKMEIIGHARASAELKRLGYDLNKIRELAKQNEERQL